ncbi:menaquinone-dependent protoporphyrinogen IX dehydrogenase [Escherichia coli]|nr:menaquinone-dependent protoporphyrinogen IX dehydrogenase [Escherichia coli]
MPSAFYSVNPVARKPEKRTPQTNSYARKFLMNSQWRPDRCAVIAGALRYPRYRWYDRFMIKLIMKMSGGETDTRKEVVYTDWGAGGEFRPRNRPFNRQTDAEISIKNKKCAVRKLF